MTDETRLTALATRAYHRNEAPDGVSRRLQKTLDEARAVVDMVRDLGQALTGPLPPEAQTPRDYSTSDRDFARGIFSTIDGQAADIERALGSIRTIVQNVRRQL